MCRPTVFDDGEQLMEEMELVRKYVVAFITDGCFANRRDSVGVLHLPLPITQSSATLLYMWSH